MKKGKFDTIRLDCLNFCLSVYKNIASTELHKHTGLMMYVVRSSKYVSICFLVTQIATNHEAFLINSLNRKQFNNEAYY